MLKCHLRSAGCLASETRSLWTGLQKLALHPLNLGHALFCYFRPLLNCSRPTAVRTSTVNSKNRQAPISVVVVDSSRQYYDRIWYYRMYW